MFLLAFLLPLLIFVSFATAQDRSLREVKAAFENANISQAIDLPFNPTLLLEVAFPQSSGPDVPVHAGIQLPRNQTAIPPVFGIQRFGSLVPARGTFVMAMVDLDPPTPQAPTLAQIRHFLGGNFGLERERTESSGLALLSNSTPALSNFLQPTPPAGSDPHRYVFLLFEQSRGFNSQTEVNASTPTTNFNISQFAHDVGLGNPLGGSFILVGPDPSTIFLSFLRLVSAQDTNLEVVKAAFDNTSIPANAHVSFIPSILFEVAFPQNTSAPVNVTAGVQLARNETAIPPQFGIQNASSSDSNGTFVVAMVDLDAPTPQDPEDSEIRHFLGGNFVAGIPDVDGLSLLSNSTAALSEFIQPTPPEGSDPHRYVFLLFNQPHGFNDQTEVNSNTSISNFNISQFVSAVGLGDPIGGTFILVGPDNSTST